MPEINLANYVVSQLSITVLTAYNDYLIVGDLSGRVSIFDVGALSLVRTFSVGGAVSGIKIDGENMVIDFIKSENLYSPSSLCQYEEAVRTHMKITQ